MRIAIVLSAALLLFPAACSVHRAAVRDPGPLTGLGEAAPGTFVALSEGIAYVPEGWSPRVRGSAGAAVVLHGFSQGEKSLSQMPAWKEAADRATVLLYFVRSETMGWQELHGSVDSERIASILQTLRKQSWLKAGGLELFGWSAGAVMSTAFAARNMKQPGGKPLFDRLVSVSGFIGYQLEKDLEKNPRLPGAVRVPVLFVWGEDEPQSPPAAAVKLFSRLGWPVTAETHPGGHFLPSDVILRAVSHQ